MKRRKKVAYRFTFFIYVCILVVAMVSALIYVKMTLNEYENEHPNRHLEDAVEYLRAEAASGALWSVQGMPDMEPGKYEEGVDIKAEFRRLINSDVTFTQAKWISESECKYGIKSGDMIIAEVILRKSAPAKQKLAIISIQEYELVSCKPVSHKYTVSVPSFVKVGEELDISFNGVDVTASEGVVDEAAKSLVFTFDGVYLKPDLKITDLNGNTAGYRLPDTVDGEIEFDSCFYTLTLPKLLSVSVNGVKMDGAEAEDGRFVYNIRLAKAAHVNISDVFGNSIQYNGASTVPLTNCTVMTDNDAVVKVNGAEVPESAVSVSVNPEFEDFAELVPDLPKRPISEIVVLADSASVTVTNKDGNVVEVDTSVKFHDLTGLSAGDVSQEVPAEVATEVDVLKIAENWSLFMTNDLDFNVLIKDLIKGSHQYEIADKYNKSVDKQFMSVHTLLTPAFTEESVKNFTWITDNCFSVDIRFIKNMRIDGGAIVQDEMNEKFYFLKYDDTDDYYSNPKWKLVAMKGGVEDAE